MKFTKTLKFKLTIWYSLILSFFCIVFVLSINIWLTSYMKTLGTEPDAHGRGFLIERVDRPRLRALSEEQRKLVMESRLEDLENIRLISIYMIFPLVLVSFGGGYVLASVMLKPLTDLNKQIQKKEAQNLNKEIKFEDKGDEISELIKNFNRMSNRLSRVFESQKEFVENSSHELKTPLSVIQANIDTILNSKRISKKELNRLLTNSKNQIEFMNDLTEDLLLLSSISTSKSNIKMEKISVRKLIRRVKNTLKEKAQDNDIEIVVTNNKKDFTVKGNKILLERAFSNLLDNAIKYSNGTKVIVSTKKKEGVVYVSFKDNGKGISKGKEEKLFERFYRIDKGRSRKEGGSGLGLAITKEIIERHNGRVYVNSKYRDGAEFVVEMNGVEEEVIKD
jgi:signal transduction histidine kinase